MLARDGRRPWRSSPGRSEVHGRHLCPGHGSLGPSEPHGPPGFRPPPQSGLAARFGFDSKCSDLDQSSAPMSGPSPSPRMDCHSWKLPHPGLACCVVPQDRTNPSVPICRVNYLKTAGNRASYGASGRVQSGHGAGGLASCGLKGPQIQLGWTWPPWRTPVCTCWG